MDAGITFVLETLNEEIFHTSRKLSGVRDQMTNLRNDLTYFKDILEKWTENPIEDPAQKDLVKQFREAVYDAEDILTDFVAEETKYRNKSILLRKLAHSSDHALISKLLSVAKKIESMKHDVEEINARKIKQDEQGSNIGQTNYPRHKSVLPTVKEDNVVGFNGEAEEVLRLLTEGSDDLQVITIVGMPGLGKTTLAKMIFHNPQIKYVFDNRVWVYVSENYKVRDVFLQILGYFIKDTNEMHEMRDQDLCEKVYKYLTRRRYLVVMDDVWEPKDWDALKRAFPENHNNSRILITSRNENVARHANPHREAHRLKFLNFDESIKLLNIKALGSEECPREDLESLGRQIAIACQGLPLAIVVIGGILRKKGAEAFWWRDASKNIVGYINMDPEQNMKKIIALSFYQLPYSLKVCFLYFGIFPEDSQILVRKLIQLWIAEGFIERKQGQHISLVENIAEEYLEDLVKRNLVMVGELRSNGKIKTCHVHGVIRAFCMEIAAEENLYHEIKKFDPNTSSNLEFQKYHRICIHSKVSNFLTSQQLITFPRVRSFYCFSSEEIDLPPEHLSCIPKAFKLLRVLDGKPIIFSHFPRDLAQLAHLKYLVFSIKFNILPEVISYLSNLQTLVVHTTSRTLEIKGDTWKTLRLRHFETNASTSWKALSKETKEKEDLVSSDNLMTLSAISPETCTKAAFKRVSNINKLGIRGQLARILNGKDGSCSLENMMELKLIETLKLINDVLDVSNLESAIVRLPNGFPPTLKKLTLVNTQLNWSHMSTLGNLHNLEILKLKANAFKGALWKPKEGEFPALKVLHIEKADLAFLEASDCQFSSLRRLSLRHCTYLREFQMDLLNMSRLHVVELFWTTASAVASIKELHNEKTELGEAFKLSIYPPDYDK